MEYLSQIVQFLRNYKDEISGATAICAIIFTLITLWLQRRHNFKSLTPILEITIGNYENVLSVRLVNNGVGPLIVKEFIAKNSSKTEDDLISLMPMQPEGILWTTYYENFVNLSIPPNQKITVIELNGDPENPEFALFRDEVRKALSKITITVKYEDIYNRSMPIKNKNLEYFGRRFKENA